MSRKPMLSLRVEEELMDVLEDLSDQHGRSRSEVAREMLWRQAEGDGYEVSEVESILANRERAKQQNRVQQLRGGFRSRVLRDLKRRFENGWTPEEVEATRPGYLEEAEALWPGEDDAEERAAEVFDDLLDDYEDAHGKTAYDPFDNPFASYGGVEEGERQEAEEEARQEEEDMAEKAAELLSDGLTMQQASSRLTTVYANVGEDHALEVVKRVRRDDSGQGVPADD